jgi:transglutaminase/protease-like cytokinesis protein 3
MKRIVALVILLSLLLSGCSDILSGNFHAITPHKESNSQPGDNNASVNNYSDLYQKLVSIISVGRVSDIITVAQYDRDAIEPDTQRAIAEVMAADPIAAYAVDQITYELGTNAGQPAIAINITYLHDRSEILRIRHYTQHNQVENALAVALNDCESGLVMHITNYSDMDFELWVAAYAALHPDKVMEVPTVIASVYPNEGSNRVIELKFNYQNSRNVLRAMQANVQQLFNDAAAQVNTEGTPQERFSQLYDYLWSLNPQWESETSITPAYSLLIHGVGDSKAVAQVYAALCNRLGLDCVCITGTRSGEPWYWNFVGCDGVYYHVDLLACRQAGMLSFRRDNEMSGYVWDYSAHTTTVQETTP